jgi:hypothetical protein
MHIARKSLATNKVRILDLPITPEELARFEAGEPIEKVFPKLSLTHREFLISGMTSVEYAEVFGAADSQFGRSQVIPTT